VEYIDGGVAIVRDDKLWQVSTNFLLSEAQQPDCWRYNKATESLGEVQGNISADEAMVLLQNTSQNSTVWSIVYNLSTGQIQLAMGKDYDQVHTFKLKMKSQNCRLLEENNACWCYLVTRCNQSEDSHRLSIYHWP
ncbi:MAG: hypothetical protein ACYS80_08460, partial [Planctomycetota bacterium]